MNSKTFPTVFVACVLGFLGCTTVRPALADLVSVDSVHGTDSVTLDTDTGLEWLDLTVTANRTFDDIDAQLGAGGEFDGFRHATVAEVNTLWLNGGIVDIVTHGPPALPAEFSPANLQPALALIDLLGETLAPLGNTLTEGFTADAPIDDPLVNIIGEINACIAPAVCSVLGITPNSALASLGPNRDARDVAIAFAGHFLVRDAAPDTDGDGVADNADNCTQIANADQLDSNADGFGNRCDADLNGDCSTNFIDLGAMKSVFFSTDADADLNGDGQVNFIDLGVMKGLFFASPGPSGVLNLCD